MNLSQVLDLPASAVKRVPEKTVEPEEPAVEVAEGELTLNDSDRKLCAMLVANGESLPSVAKKLKVELADVTKFVNSVEGAKEIVLFQSSKGNDPRARVKNLTNLALDVATNLLLTGKEPTRMKLAIDLMDRGMGKAVQVIETKNLDMTAASMEAADKAIAAQVQRLAHLENLEKKLRLAQSNVAA